MTNEKVKGRWHGLTAQSTKEIGRGAYSTGMVKWLWVMAQWNKATLIITYLKAMQFK